MLEHLYHFGVALGIGLLLGLERESAQKAYADQQNFGGIRTFPMLAVLGCTAGMLGDLNGSALSLVIPILIGGAFLFVAYIGTIKRGDFGMTSEVAGLLTMLLGALCYYGQIQIASVLSIVILLLLSSKGKLHSASNAITKEEIISVAQFGLMTFLILPILPDEPVFPAPFDVLIPRNIWLMVILVTAISMLGYFLKKFIGSNKAIVLTGFLGGLISSTAVSLSFSSKSKERPDLARVFAIAVIVAWITMFIRVIVEVAVVNTPLVQLLWIPMMAASLAGAVYCGFLRKKEKEIKSLDMDGGIEKGTPFSLKKSLLFGGLYAVVIIVANIAQIRYGEEGIYVSAMVAGFTDVDAITLSMAEMSKASGTVSLDVANKAITLAAVANTIVKVVIVMTSAHKALKKEILPGAILIVVAALLAAFLV